MITTRILAWYLSGLFALAALVESFISYTPAAQTMGNIVQSVCVLIACWFVVTGLLLQRLSAQHWLNRSAPLRIVLFVFAITCTVMVLLGTLG